MEVLNRRQILCWGRCLAHIRSRNCKKRQSCADAGFKLAESLGHLRNTAGTDKVLEEVPWDGCFFHGFFVGGLEDTVAYGEATAHQVVPLAFRNNLQELFLILCVWMLQFINYKQLNIS